MDAIDILPMSRPLPTPETFQRETIDRLRRMETRLTRYMEAQGFTTEVRRPSFDDGVLSVPTDAQSLRDCLAAIPDLYEGMVTITHKGVVIAKLLRQ